MPTHRSNLVGATELPGRWMDRPSMPTIVHLIDSLRMGGTESALVRLLQRFAGGPPRHAVVTMRRAGPLTCRLPERVGCYALEIPHRCRTAGIRIAQYLERKRAHVLHVRNTGCWLDGLIAASIVPRLHLVLGYHGLDNADGFTRRHRRLIRWAVRTGARFTTVSEAGRSELIVGAGVPVERITVLPNGVDIAAIDAAREDATAERTTLRESLGCGPNAIVVGSVGALTTVKGYDVLINAVARCIRRDPRINLWLIGEGAQRSVLRRQAQRHGITNHVRLPGYREDAVSCLYAMDAYACPSRSECMSNALLEAMASGLPVVATDIGGNRELLQAGGGLPALAGCPQSLADRIMQIVTTPTLARALRRSARTVAEKYTLEHTVAHYQRYYASLLAGSSIEVFAHLNIVRGAGHVVLKEPASAFDRELAGVSHRPTMAEQTLTY